MKLEVDEATLVKKVGDSLLDEYEYNGYTLRELAQTIRGLEEALRGKAEWKDRFNDGDWHCSNCGAIIEKDEQKRHYWVYCYHCGRRMKNAG